MSATYIACTNPRYPNVAPSHELTRQMEGWTYLELPTGHNAMLSMPGAPRRTPPDQSRGPRVIVRMSRENFLWGAPRIRGELLKLGFVVSQATVSCYMPRRGLSAEVAHLPAEPSVCDRCDRFRRAGRLSDVVRRWIRRVARRATKVRDGIRCGLVEPSSTLHPLWP